jgi:hypothetical protein
MGACRVISRHARRLLHTEPATHPAWGPLAGAEQLLIAYDKAKEAQTVPDVRQVLIEHGGWLGSYLPETSLLGVGPQRAAGELRMLEGVVWVVSFQRVSPTKSNSLSLHVCINFRSYNGLQVGLHLQNRLLMPGFCQGCRKGGGEGLFIAVQLEVYSL